MGNVRGGLKRKNVLPKANAEFPAVFISPKSELLRKVWLVEKTGERERKDDSSPGGLLHKIFELFPQSGHIFMPEET